MSADRREPDGESPDRANEDLERMLDRAAEFEREVLAETRGPASTADRARVDAALERAWANDARPPRRRAWLAAAALVLAGLGAWWWFGRAGEHGGIPDLPLGNREVEIVSPKGEVDSFDVVRWRTSTRGAVRFDLRIVDEVTRAVLLQKPDLQATEYSLENVDTRAWQRILVEIDELDAGGAPVRLARGSAWLRSR